MHYFLVGCFVVVLIYLSAEGNVNVFQKPRFIGVKTGQTVMIYCVPSNPSLPAHVKWFKSLTVNSDKVAVNMNSRITIKEKSDHINASITIKKVEKEDSGIYYCTLNGTYGSGSGLKVVRYSNPEAILMRSRVKDVIIFLQAFLLILCIVVPLVQHYRLERKEEAVYEEPENDHIYEGLEIEQAGGDLYEDISTFAQSRDAAWEVESPDQE